MSLPFSSADILLPEPTPQGGTAWSCVACDQYTSEPAYWERVEALVGGCPSTLRLIIPEVYLSQTLSRKEGVLSAMDTYLKEVLVEHPDTMILVERALGSRETRWGLVGAVDLMAYEYRRGADSLIRATEATVAERIPARMTIRRDAPIELPHVMMLVDDRQRTVVEPLVKEKESLAVAYDHDLMENSGHLKGYFLTASLVEQVKTALAALVTPEAMERRYGKPDLSPLLFAVGDGNHSLAAAKACFEELRASLGEEEAMRHPARYALCEVVNLYDSSLHFEPIYRVVFGVEPADLLKAFRTYVEGLRGEAAPQRVEWVYGDARGTVTIPSPRAALPVGTVQDFLDEYMKTAPRGATIDYIHGEDTAIALARAPQTLAFLFEGMTKEELFSTVIADGALPRKTFSMGHAQDKRFYTEVRRIR